MSQDSAIRREVTVKLLKGLHLRPLAMIVRMAMQFDSTITLTNGSKTVNARNQMDLMLLNAGNGSKIVVEAEGADAPQAVEEMARLFDSDFDGDDLIDT